MVSVEIFYSRVISCDKQTLCILGLKIISPGSQLICTCKIYTLLYVQCTYLYLRIHYSRRKNSCHKILPAHCVVTKRDFILRSSFCKKYIIYTYEGVNIIYLFLTRKKKETNITLSCSIIISSISHYNIYYIHNTHYTHIVLTCKMQIT